MARITVSQKMEKMLLKKVIEHINEVLIYQQTLTRISPK